MGEPNEVRPGRGEFHENPSSCICEEPGAANAKRDQGSQKSGREESDAARKDDQNMDDELEWMDPDDDEEEDDDQTGVQETGLANGSDLDYSVPGTEEPPELEEMLSD